MNLPRQRTETTWIKWFALSSINKGSLLNKPFKLEAKATEFLSFGKIEGKLFRT